MSKNVKNKIVENLGYKIIHIIAFLKIFIHNIGFSFFSYIILVILKKSHMYVIFFIHASPVAKEKKLKVLLKINEKYIQYMTNN